MNKHLQVSFKLNNGQQIWIQHPDLSATIHASEKGLGSFDDVTIVAQRLANSLGLDDVELELDEIHDGELAYEVELWDYSNGAEMIKSINLEAAV